MSAARRLGAAHLVAIVLVALAVRAGVGIMANGNGEMEGLAPGYQESAYAMAAGYGFVHPVEAQPREVDLVALADAMAARGERLTPRNAPPITAGRWRPTALHPPGYPAFLLAIYRVAGPPATVWARVLQAILDAFACLLVVAIAARFGDPFVQGIAGYGYAAMLPVAYMVTSRVADALVPPLFVLAVWLFLRAFDSRRALPWAGCGATCAALWMLRPDYALLPPALWLTALLLARPRRAAFTGGLVMLGVTALLVLPWAIRNRAAIGEFTPGTTATGMVMLQSVGMTANPYGVLVDDGWYSREALRAGCEGIDDPRASRMFVGRYLAIVRANPLLVLRGGVQRLLFGAVPPYHWGLPNPHYEGHNFYNYHDREGTGPLETLRRHPDEILAAYWDRFLFVPVSAILLLACILLLARSGAAWREAVLLLGPWAFVVLAHVPLYMTVRMMVPGLFAQLVALGCVIQSLRGRPQPYQANRTP